MAIGVIGGLVLSTALSLIVVPAFYVIAERIGGKKKKHTESEALAHDAMKNGTAA
jgi:predicted RND superfamily exporter protein